MTESEQKAAKQVVGAAWAVIVHRAGPGSAHWVALEAALDEYGAATVIAAEERDAADELDRMSSR